jgi:hypothetical protein
VNVDAGVIAKQELKQLQFFNVLEVGRDSRGAVKLLEKATGAEPYYNDDPFHILPNHFLGRHRMNLPVL